MTAGANRNVALPYYVSALSLAIPAILLGVLISGWIGFIPVIKDGHTDFRNLYTAGYMLRSGHRHELYDYRSQKTFQDALVSPEQIAIPFLRPAYQAVLFAPFSLLPCKSAYLVFFIFNIAVLVVCFRLLRPYMSNLAQVGPWLPFAMFLFVPISAALMQGQDSLILLALLAGAFVSLDRGRNLIAGLLTGLGLFKFQLVIPIALLFVIWRRWRYSTGFALSAIVVGMTSVWITGWSQFETYVRSILNIGIWHNFAPGSLLPIQRMPNLHGLVFGVLGGAHLAAPVVAATSGIILIVAAVKRPQCADALGVAITVSSVVSYYLFIHDMSALLIPIVLTLNSFVECEATGDRMGRIKARAAATLFAAPVCMSFFPDHFYLIAIPLLFFMVVTFSASSVQLGLRMGLPNDRQPRK